MKTLNISHPKPWVAALLMLAASHAWCAQPSPSLDEANVIYANMCMETAEMPKEFGEADLKGHPKLRQYCTCLGKLYAPRALKSLKELSNNPNYTAPPLEVINKETLAMQNTCRMKYALPPAKEM